MWENKHQFVSQANHSQSKFSSPLQLYHISSQFVFFTTP
jgi:hypothetical protein